MRWFRRRRVPASHVPIFSFDGDPLPRSTTCTGCGEAHEGVTGFVLRHGDAYAVYWADWFPHSDEMIVNLVLGEFGEDADHSDNVLFGTRYGHVDQQVEAAASLITPTIEDTATGARPLDRDAALQHPLLADLWQVSDWLVENDPLLHREVFHMPARSD